MFVSGITKNSTLVEGEISFRGAAQVSTLAQQDSPLHSSGSRHKGYPGVSVGGGVCTDGKRSVRKTCLFGGIREGTGESSETTRRSTASGGIAVRRRE